MTATSQQKEELRSQLTPAIRTGVGLMHLVVKNFTLYPETNSIRYQSLEKFHQWLTEFLTENETLRLDVESDSLFCDKDLIFKDKAGEQPLVSPLFRDGIQWFEFCEGVSLNEIETFINLLGRFKVLKEEAEDDLATALWEAELPNIKHKTADEFWEADPMAELQAMKNILDSSDEREANVQAHVSVGSKTVGMVLDALNRKKAVGGQMMSTAGSSGFAPGSGGASGEEIDVEGHDGGGSEEGELPQVLLAQGQEAEAAATAETAAAAAQPDEAGMVPAQPGQTQPAQASDDDEVEHEMTELFNSLLSNLESAVNTGHSGKKTSGSAGPVGPGKKQVKDSNLVVVNDEDIESGSRHLPGFIDDDEGDVTYTDAAMAEALFKASTYFDTQGESPFWRLTREETARLRMMIAYEEARSNTSDCLDILLILLNSLSRPEEHLAVVDFIADEAQYAIGNGDIVTFRKFLEQLEDDSTGSQPWMKVVAVELRKRLSSPEILNVLADPAISEHVTPEFLEDLRSFLHILDPEAVYALVPVLSKVGDQKMDKVLVEAIAYHGSRIQSPIDTLISTMKQSMLLEFINCVKNGSQPFPTQLFLGLTRNEMPLVREEAAKALLEASPDNIKYMFHLVDDSSITVNQLICQTMSQTRNPLAERILLDYINDHQEQSRNRSKGHILNCYRAFGLCSSAQSITFLNDTLMKKDWKTFLGFDSQWHRVGAALALMLMPAEWETGPILAKAAQSRLRNIRQAYEQAGDLLRSGWILTNE
ncbi:hypothetical protein LJB99_04190 [Deltaproteobacteria bacterium OttesenSCG-928-K17]|nr:hypothetical protein [Deltaproteobacteria bacterium OttesenSCG-928-K17]